MERQESPDFKAPQVTADCQAPQVSQKPPAPKVQKADVEDAKLDVQVNEML